MTREDAEKVHAVAWLTDANVWATQNHLHIDDVVISRMDAVQCIINLAHMGKRERKAQLKNLKLVHGVW